MVVQEYPGEASVRSGALFHMSSWYDYRLWLLANTCQRSSFYSAIITTNSAFRTKIVVYNNPSKSNCVSFECQKILESDLSYLPLSDVLRLSFHPTNKKNLDAEIDSFHVNESLLACMIHKSAICKWGSNIRTWKVELPAQALPHILHIGLNLLLLTSSLFISLSLSTSSPSSASTEFRRMPAA